MSLGVTLVRSSIFSTSACGVGTQITSLPGCPTCGSNGFLVGCASAMLRVTVAATPATASDRMTDWLNVIDTSDERAVDRAGRFARRGEHSRVQQGCQQRYRGHLTQLLRDFLRMANELAKALERAQSTAEPTEAERWWRRARSSLECFCVRRRTTSPDGGTRMPGPTAD